MERGVRVHRPLRRPEGIGEQWRKQIEAYRRSLELFHSALSAQVRIRRTVALRKGAPAPTPLAIERPIALAPPAPSAEADWGPLTRRERDVAALIAHGCSNRAIARELVLTEGTAANHVRRILLRLGFDSRAQVAAWVAGDEPRRADRPAAPQQLGRTLRSA